MLADSQFVENRVYEDDDAEEEEEKKEETDAAKEDSLSLMKTAFSSGLAALKVIFFAHTCIHVHTLTRPKWNYDSYSTLLARTCHLIMLNNYALATVLPGSTSIQMKMAIRMRRAKTSTTRNLCPS